MNGYDASFPVACAEDVELPIACRHGAEDEVCFLKRWSTTRIQARCTISQEEIQVRRSGASRCSQEPSKVLKDSHTPQIMKLQLLFAPALLLGLAVDVVMHSSVPLWAIVPGAFLVTTLPFTGRAFRERSGCGTAISGPARCSRLCATVGRSGGT